MKQKIVAWFSVIIILFSFVTPSVQGNDKDKMADDFNIDLTGYEQYEFGTFNQIGYKITPLAQLYFGIIQTEHEWIDTPRLYLKGNKGFVHLWKKDGTNVLYQVDKRSDGTWNIVDVKRKKINRIPVPKGLIKEAFIERMLDPISNAIDTNYKPKLWFRDEEKILKITKDDRKNELYVTIQVITFEGPHNPPYGEETMTFLIKGGEVILMDYKHRDIPEEKYKKLQLR